MTQFDILLRRALMDANLAQYESVLRQAGAAQPDLSPGYFQERTRLLADPWGWGRSRSPRGRLNWRLIALIAALLLLSACAYAVVTGQFSQWFPSRGVNYQAPETSEAVLGQISTVIGETRTEGDAEITLNAASWDGESLLLSLVIKSPEVPGLPADYVPGPTGPYGNGLHTAECYLSLREDQWFEYEKGRLGDYYSEAEARERLTQGPSRWFPLFQLLSREDDTLTFELWTNLGPYVERPELTLHLENLSFYQHDGFHIPGPIEFAFTLEKTIPTIYYKSDGPEVTMGTTPPLRKVPMRFTDFAFSSTGVDMSFLVLAPVDTTMRLEYRYDPADSKESDPLRIADINLALWDGPLGIWTEDGSYVDLTESGGVSTGGSESWGRFRIYSRFSYPYPISPAAVTALDIGGVRVELSELERTSEPVS